MKKNIGFYPFINNTAKMERVSIEDVLEKIKNPGLKSITEKIRSFTEEAQQKKYKNTLPSVSLSGVFEKRSKDRCLEASGLIQVDIDGLKTLEIPSIIARLKKDRYTHFLFVSPRGKGLKLGVKIPANTNLTIHSNRFRSLVDYYKQEYDLQVDEKVKDFARLMFLCFDPNVYYNPDSEVYTLYKESAPFVEVKKNNRPKTSNDIKYSSEEKLRFLHAQMKRISKYDINLCEDYHDWFEIGLILSREFGEFGLDYFLEISERSPKFNLDENIDQYYNCLDKNKGEKTLGSLKWMIDEAIEKLIVYPDLDRKPKPFSRWSKQEEDFALSAYKKGFGTNEIGERIGRSGYSVYKKLERMNLIES